MINKEWRNGNLYGGQNFCTTQAGASTQKYGVISEKEIELMGMPSLHQRKPWPPNAREQSGVSASHVGQVRSHISLAPTTVVARTEKAGEESVLHLYSNAQGEQHQLADHGKKDNHSRPWKLSRERKRQEKIFHIAEDIMAKEAMKIINEACRRVFEAHEGMTLQLQLMG